MGAMQPAMMAPALMQTNQQPQQPGYPPQVSAPQYVNTNMDLMKHQ